MWKINKNNKELNRGFSLFTVIIAVSFIAILGLLVIYISVSNFYMKTTDLKSKDGFYTAERGLEEVKVGLQQDVGDAMSKAFIEVMETYDKEDSSGQSQSAIRQKRFQKLFVDNLRDILKKGDGAGGKYKYDLEYLNNEEHLNSSHVLTDASRESLLLVCDGEADLEDMTENDQSGKKEVVGLILKNLKIIYVDAKGHASIIKTDICLGTPKVQFPTSSTLPDLMSMVVVANGGIICEPDENSENPEITLRGNIYAGLIEDKNIIGQINTDYGSEKYGNKTSIWVKKGAALNVESNNMLVTRAEINVDHGTFSTGSKVQLWTRGITLKSSLAETANVTLQGTSYLADDITVASGVNASDANVTLQGAYYGYGSVESEEKLKEELDQRIKKTDKATEKTLYETIKNGCIEQYEGYNHEDQYTTSDLSSAIMINGKNTTLDLSKVEKMVLSGNSYISAGNTGSSKNIMTGESVTVKGSQLAYLAPAEILGNDSENSSVTNPLEITEENKNKFSELLSGDDNAVIPVKWDTAADVWGGKTLNDLEAKGININRKQPVQRVIYRDPGGDPYAYFYLNFEQDDNSDVNTNASKYMQFYYENNGDMKTRMDNYFSFYFNGLRSGILVNDEEAYARYITNGNLLSFETNNKTETKEGKLYKNAGENTISGLVDTSVANRLTWYTLNRKMIYNYGNLNTEKKDSDSDSKHNEASYSQSVFDNIVNETKMVEYLHENYADKGFMCQYPAEDSGTGPQVIMLDNKKGKDLEITGELASTLRLVVCTGNVVIGNDVQFNGIIMAKGKITLKAGATLQAAPIEAANVFQAQMGANTELKPEDFFWDGNNYVRGNSSSDDDVTDEIDIADYVYYQNWKKQ